MTSEDFNVIRQTKIEALQLIAKFNLSIISRDEHVKLDKWITENDFNQELFEMLSDPQYKSALTQVANSIS
jgi:hypothetical protein